MATTADIDAALAELRVSDKPNVSAVARKYNIEVTRLWRLYNCKTTTLDDYNANRGLLSPQQDKFLLELVRRLTSNGLPPTPKLVRQFAKDLSGNTPGKNWPSRWLKRHQDQLGSGYLEGFDLDRKKADSFWQYRAYFELVVALIIHETCADF
jgi:hypothetical protein